MYDMCSISLTFFYINWGGGRIILYKNVYDLRSKSYIFYTKNRPAIALAKKMLKYHLYIN